MEPHYEHDCDQCYFLMSIISQDKGKFDIYYCHKCDGGTLLARFGNEPEAYSSWPIAIYLQWIEKDQGSSAYRATREALARYGIKRLQSLGDPQFG